MFAGDLAPFDQITPCGIANVAMTSMEKELGKPIRLAGCRESAEQVAQHCFADLRAGGN